MRRDANRARTADDETGVPENPEIGRPPATGPGTPLFPFVPVAEEIGESSEELREHTPDPEGPLPPSELTPLVPAAPPLTPFPLPPLCLINLRAGCYRITFKPNAGFSVFRGTLRVDRSGGRTTVSGDLYRFLDFPFPFPVPPVVGPVQPLPSLPAIPPIPPISLPLNIPIYARSRYYSYLKVTSVVQPPLISSAPCRLRIAAEEYVYTHPPAGSFNGTFPSAPGTRQITMVLQRKAAPAGFSSSYFEGKLFEGGAEKGTVTLGWVSTFFRRATLEIDTLTGSVAPTAVPGNPGPGTENFRTVFASAGWDLSVTYDQTGIPVPAGVTATNCWSSANLHALMLSVRKPTTNLDTEWRMHLVVVPATMGCGRGVMYDQIAVPREGVASFSDDGYPSTDSAFFGTAANKKQRDVPRAFLRSASHELGHGFNQIHQEQEGGADNSIMTTTPSVADVLGTAATGQPGIFPDDIALRFNDHVRHHLVHFPDVTVRPGGMTFGSGHSSTVPEADRHYFSTDELELRLEPASTQIALGEPLRLAWALTNRSQAQLPVPSDISTESFHTFIVVTDPQGGQRLMSSFVIRTDPVKIVPLDPGGELRAETRVFWSSNGFAFEVPGKYSVEVRITWMYGGLPLGARTTADVWVNFPLATADNNAAATLLDPQVGMYVALGGGATHLTDAVNRLNSVFAPTGAEGRDEAAGAGVVMPGYEGILPGD